MNGTDSLWAIITSAVIIIIVPALLTASSLKGIMDNKRRKEEKYVCTEEYELNGNEPYIYCDTAAGVEYTEKGAVIIYGY